MFPNVDYNKKSKTLVGIKIKQGSENLHKEGFTDNRLLNLKMLLNDNGEKLSDVLESVSKANKKNTDIGNLYNELKETEFERDKIVQNIIAFYDAELKHVSTLQNESNKVTPTQLTFITKELEEVKSVLNFDLKSEYGSSIQPDLLSIISDTVKEKCPVLNSFIAAVVIDELSAGRNKVETAEVKHKRSMQLLSAMLQVRSSLAKNDLALVFGVVSLSYGAGQRFITFLNKIGLSKSWATLLRFLEKRLKNYQTVIDAFPQKHAPLILAFDNINFYRGFVTHHRVFHKKAPNMWNFTVRCVIKPNLCEIKQLFETKETAYYPQKPLDEVVVDDILLDSKSNEPLKHMWNDQQDRYLLQILDICLNKVPSSFYKLRSEPMEKVDQFLAQEKANITTENAKIQNYKISVPLIKQDFPKKILNEKSQILPLPLSTQNEASL